jgi:hypothetical protein
MRIHRILAASLVAFMVSILGSITPQQAVAASDNPVTIVLTATVDQVDDWANVLGGTIHPGDTITGAYTYNAAASNISPTPNIGNYRHTTAPYGIRLKAGGKVFETDPQNVLFSVSLWNNYQNGDYSWDLYAVISQNNRPLSDNVKITGISWFLEDPSQTALKSVALPKTAPKLGNWDQSRWGLVVDGFDPTISEPHNDYTFRIRAHVTQAQKITR